MCFINLRYVTLKFAFRVIYCSWILFVVYCLNGWFIRSINLSISWKLIILNYFQFLLRPAVTQFLFDFELSNWAVQAETFLFCRMSKNSSKKVSTFLASTSNQSLVRVWRMPGLNVPLAISNSVRFCFNYFFCFTF